MSNEIGLNEVVAARELAKTLAIRAVETMKSDKTLNSEALLIYRCDNQKRCALLYVHMIDGNRVVHQPRYKFSDEVNQRESVQAARDKYTEDGNNKWKENTFPLSYAGGLLSLQCDHCLAQIDVATIKADLAAATRKPTTITVKNATVR